MGTMTDSWLLAWRLIAGADPELAGIAMLSLRVSFSACCIGAAIGLPVGAWLAVARFPGHRLLVWMVNTLLAMPAVLVGLLVYLLLSRSGPLGDLGILFTPTAMVVAQSALVAPLIAALSRRLVLAALAEGGSQLSALGARPMTTALLLLVHDRTGAATVLLTAFARAIAEVGAVMIVGGNIAGVTRVMTTAIALETSKGDLALALALGIVLLAVVGAVNAAMALLQHLGQRVRPAPPPPATAAAAAVPMPAANRPPADLDAPALVVAARATVRFGATVALREISLTVRQGERLVLVGPNGSGKSTLLQLLHGLLPCQGHCAAQALPPQGQMPRTAMLFQRPFMLHLSVWRNVWIGLWLAGVAPREREARCREALTQVGLLGHAGRPARALSGGQQQRLGLARAWALRPDILFLDEPTASLDPGATQEIEALIDNVASSGTTVVMSTHNLGQARRLATRVAYLEAGRLVVERPVAAFFEAPLPPAAARFVQSELGDR